MAACGAKHPEDPTRTCLLRSPQHAEHMDVAGAWPNEVLIERARLLRENKPPRGRTKGASKSPALKSLAGAAAGSRNENLRKETQAKREVMEATLLSTPEEFRQHFLAAVHYLALGRETLTSDDVWEDLEARGIDTENRSSVGPLMAAAARKGFLVKTDQRAVSSRPNSKARDGLTVWKSLVCPETISGKD